MPENIFSKNFKHLRKSANLSQDKLAKALDMNINRIQTWEQGKQKPLNRVIIKTICDYFKITEQELFEADLTYVEPIDDTIAEIKSSQSKTYQFGS